MTEYEVSGTWSHGHDLDYFRSMYAGDADPWGFDRRRYETRKYELTCAALPQPRYRRALEPGCANGTLTALLARRCEVLIAYDIIESAVERASSRLADQPHVQVTQGLFPDHWPEGTGDLVVWSEVAYYLTNSGGRVALQGLNDWLVPGGDLVAVHYTGSTNYPRHGSTIGPWLDQVAWLRRTTTLVDGSFDLGIWRRVE